MYSYTPRGMAALSNQKKRNTVHAGSLHAGLVSPPDELPPPFYEPPPPESLDLQPFGTLYSGDLSSDTAPFFNYTPNSYPYPNTPTHTLLPPLPFQTDYYTHPTVALFPSQQPMPVERPFSHTRSNIQPEFDLKHPKAEQPETWSNEKTSQPALWNKPSSSATMDQSGHAATPTPGSSTQESQGINPSLIGPPAASAPSDDESDDESRASSPVKSPSPLPSIQQHSPPVSPTSSTSKKGRDLHRKQIEDRAANKRKSATNKFAKVLANRINSMPENGLANQLNMAAKLMETDGKRIMQLENDKRVLERKYNSLESQVSKLKAKIYRLESRDDAMDAD